MFSCNLAVHNYKFIVNNGTLTCDNFFVYTSDGDIIVKNINNLNIKNRICSSSIYNDYIYICKYVNFILNTNLNLFTYNEKLIIFNMYIKYFICDINNNFLNLNEINGFKLLIQNFLIDDNIMPLIINTFILLYIYIVTVGQVNFVFHSVLIQDDNNFALINPLNHIEDIISNINNAYTYKCLRLQYVENCLQNNFMFVFQPDGVNNFFADDYTCNNINVIN